MGISLLGLLSFLIPITKKILKVKEAAELLGLSPSKIYQLVQPDKEGIAELASTKVGGKIGVLAREVERYIRENMTPGRQNISEFNCSIRNWGIEIKIFRKVR